MRSQILAIQKMQDYIEAHLIEEITLATLADITLANWTRLCLDTFCAASISKNIYSSIPIEKREPMWYNA